MTYELEFSEKAWKEWAKLGSGLKEQFKKKLSERLLNPHVSADRLKGLGNAYKIKLRSAGYRMVYRVKDEVLIVTVIAIGKREGGDIYENAASVEQSVLNLGRTKSTRNDPIGNLLPAFCCQR